MSIYDSSPEAVASFLATQKRCNKWAGDTSKYAFQYKAPFGTRSDIGSSLEEVDPLDIDAATFGLVESEREEMHRLLGPSNPRPSRHPERTRSQGHHRRSRSKSRDFRDENHSRSRSHRRHKSRSRHESVRAMDPRYAPQNTLHGYYQTGPYAPQQPFIPPPLEPTQQGGIFSLFKRSRSKSIPRQNLATGVPLHHIQQAQEVPRSRTKSFDVSGVAQLSRSSGKHALRRSKSSKFNDLNSYPPPCQTQPSHQHPQQYCPTQAFPYQSPATKPHMSPYAQYIYSNSSGSPTAKMYQLQSHPSVAPQPTQKLYPQPQQPYAQPTQPPIGRNPATLNQIHQIPGYTAGHRGYY